MKADSNSALRAQLRAEIRNAGLRCTAARLTVLTNLQKRAAPATHAEVAAALAPAGFDRATIYRNLVEMTEAGLLSRVDLGDHVWRFEMRRAGHDNDHPHFLCTECGTISCLADVEVTINQLPRTKQPSVGKITEVLLKGRCRQCD